MPGHLLPSANAIPATSENLTEQLPALLLGVLERRYLTNFQAEDWRFTPDVHPGVPMLREVVALGRPADEYATVSMASALAACHDPGQALIGVLHGTPDESFGHRHRLYYGARRLAGGADADGFLDGQASCLAAHFPGIELARAEGLRAHPSLSAFLRSAPVVAAVTGIPSVAGERPVPGLDRLTKSIGNREYAIVTVAEPLSALDLDAALDACRRLLSEISSYTGRQVSQSRGSSDTEDLTKLPTPSRLEAMPPCLQQCATFFTMVMGNPLLAGLSLGGSILILADRMDPPKPSTRRSHTDSWQESISVSTVDAVAQACNELLARHTARLQAGRGWGWWRVAVYVAADGDATLQAVGRSIRAVATGKATGLEPIRMISLAPAVFRNCLLTGSTMGMRPNAEDAPHHPLGTPYEALATCLTSEELAILLAPPRQEIPGLMVRNRGEFAVTVPAPSEPAFDLGRVRDAAGDLHASARVTAGVLNEHTLVIGTPGSGKTNTCMHLLLESDRIFRIPFLVIEPAKAEYRRLKQVMGKRLRVFSVGGPDGELLRLNPLAPVRGASLLGHIDLLKAVFNASFTMYPGMPQILEQALLEVYEERGWNLQTDANDALGTDSDPADAAVLTPCLGDLHDQIERVMLQKGYGGEVRQNLGAALRSRLHGLMIGAKGMCMNTRRSTSAEELFDHPVVLELQHLRDDEEKAFLMAVVFMLLYQYCEVRQRQLPPAQQEQLQHLTLIEEAHRLLAAPQGISSADSANPRGKAVGMFTDMLAELRALGEGFIIAEQIPSKLASDALKNTNLKIIHRLTAPTERASAGQCVNLTDRQLWHLANLSKGLAVVHGLSASEDDAVGDAALVQIQQVKGTSVLSDSWVAPRSPGGTGDAAKRHGGCDACPSPCEFFHRVEPKLRRSKPGGWVRTFAEAILMGHAAKAWDLWRQWQALRTGGSMAGEDFCWFVHVMREWTLTVLAARGTTTEGPAFRPADRLKAEQLSAGFGRLARNWLGRREWDTEADAAFRTLHQALQAELTAAPPPDLPGCATCPARCRILPWIATMDLAKAAAVLAKTVRGPTDAFNKPMTTELQWTRLAAALTLLDRQTEPPDGIDPSTWRRDWRYCLLNIVELPPELADYRGEFLAEILKSGIEARR